MEMHRETDLPITSLHMCCVWRPEIYAFLRVLWTWAKIVW